MGVIALSAVGGRTTLPPVPTFGENLKRLRGEAMPPLSQQALAKRLGHVNNSTISKWETQALVPEPATIEQVARAIGVEPRQLLEGVVTGYDALRAPVEHRRAGPAQQKKISDVTSPVPTSGVPLRVRIPYEQRGSGHAQTAGFPASSLAVAVELEAHAKELRARADALSALSRLINDIAARELDRSAGATSGPAAHDRAVDRRTLGQGRKR